MYSLLITITILLSIFLIIIVLLQSSKGSGLAGTFGGAGGGLGSTFGTRRTADFLSKATWWLGGAIFVLTVAINLFFLPGQMTSDQRESIIQSSSEQRAVPTAPALPQVQSEEPAEQPAE